MKENRIDRKEDQMFAALFAALFGKSDRRVSALKMMRKLHLQQLNGLGSGDVGKVLANERRIWNRVLTAFSIEPMLGAEANLDRIDDLLSFCQGQSGRFDYIGLVVPTLMQNSGFVPADREVLARHLADRGMIKAQRRAQVTRTAPILRSSPVANALPA